MNVGGRLSRGLRRSGSGHNTGPLGHSKGAMLSIVAISAANLASAVAEWDQIVQNQPLTDFIYLLQVIDSQGYRANVGIILCNEQGQLLWARRLGQQSWQFPQGGIKRDETPKEALYRELREEVGLEPEDVEIIGQTRSWLRYRLPKRFIRHHSKPLCIGQKQRWYMLRLVGSESHVRLDRSGEPEFDKWRWVQYWQPLEEIVFFKRRVYERALMEFAPLILPEDRQQMPRIGRSSYMRQRSRSQRRG